MSFLLKTYVENYVEMMLKCVEKKSRQYVKVLMTVCKSLNKVCKSLNEKRLNGVFAWVKAILIFPNYYIINIYNYYPIKQRF